MQRTSHLVALPLTILGICGTFAVGLSGCRSESQPSLPGSEQVYGPRIGTVLRLAGELGVKERHMMAAGYVSGHFGLTEGQKSQQWLFESGRSNSVGLDLRAASDLQQQTFRSQMEFLAREIRARAERQQPSNDFDWLALIAQAVVGEFEPDPNIRALQVRLVLIDLIEANNSGFNAALNDKEVYTLQPAGDDERIDLRLLDPGQLRLLNGFRFQGDGLADLSVEGNAKVRTGILRNPGKLPKLVIRLCPSTTLRCFEALRKTSNLGAHFLSYRGLNGTRETIQLHDSKFELNWHEEAQKDVVTLMLSGVTGVTRESMRPDLFDWEDYVSLRSFIRRAAGRLTQDIFTDNPNLLQKEFIRTAVQETKGLIDENVGESEFPLGSNWDSELFRELLTSETLPKQLSQLKIEQPSNGQTIAGTVIEGAVYPDSESGQIQIFQDSTDPKSDGSPWDLVLKRDIDPSQRRFDFTHEIRRTGLNGNQMRALKVVNRRVDGSLLGSRIIRLRVGGISRP
ncbi:hypothetical protein EBU99_10405 [bacterium]|nr:hypothetical protein [bacterium]